MQQFQSLQRLLLFYTLTLAVMLSLYYVTIFLDLEAESKQASVEVFNLLQHEFTQHVEPTNPELKKILERPVFQSMSYQLVFIRPSGQTFIHRNIRTNENTLISASFPALHSLSENNSHYELNNQYLNGSIKPESGSKIYVLLHHKPLEIDWISYRYWLPLMTAIMFFIIALLYMLNRQTNWQQLIVYTDNLSAKAKEAYLPPPFINKNSTSEFLRLGNALSRISYQLHSNHRRIQTLQHRLERLVEQAPLPMAMIMRHGQISFFNQRFEQVFATLFESDETYKLTDFVSADDEPSQRLLQELSSQRVTRTVIVNGLDNKQAYQLHITPWFSEHGQIHGFTALLNNINELVNQNDYLQQHNQQLQKQLETFNELKPVISHELRAPLNTIIGTLTRVNTASLSSQQNAVLKVLTRSSNAMLLMLNDLLDMDDTELLTSELTDTSLDIYKLGQQVSELALSNARQQGLELLYFFAPDCPRYIHSDNKHLRKILLNLMDNAIDLTTSGFVALTIEAVVSDRTAPIEREGSNLTPLNNVPANNVPANNNPANIISQGDKMDSSHQWIRFRVQSSGAGITAVKPQQLHSDSNETGKHAHTLLDKKAIETEFELTSSKSLAHLLGGFIELEISDDKSNSNKGSIFNLYLPCRQPVYQPIYHLNQHLTQIHLIAIVNQTLMAENLQRLCQHLSITASIYTAIDMKSVHQLLEKLALDKLTLAPILLMDYEYYEKVKVTVANYSELNYVLTSTHLTHKDLAQNHQLEMDPDIKQALKTLLSKEALPKILLSIKSERRLTSSLLYKYDGFLNKPLDSGLFLSELLRLTLPLRQSFERKQSTEVNSISQLEQPENALYDSVDEPVAPLVLVVEDSITNQKITCKILAKLGYRSVIAEDGQQALEKLEQQRQEIMLILMDCRMPVMDGMQATQAIRAQGDDIPIIALTANNTEEDRESCISVGMDDFLSKPVNKNKLQTVLEKFIDAQ